MDKFKLFNEDPARRQLPEDRIGFQTKFIIWTIFLTGIAVGAMLHSYLISIGVVK